MSQGSCFDLDQLGKWEFFGRSFRVSPKTLIPRPETEELVEHAIQWLKQNPQARIGVDVGTGSGCIAITILSEMPQLEMHAVDISTEALEIAEQNAIIHNIDNIFFRQQDLLTMDNHIYDLICANLPYIPTRTLEELDVVKHEPWIALDGGDTGLELIEKLLVQARKNLAKEFFFILEFEYRHGQKALKLANKYYPNATASILKDLSKNDRFLVIKS